jgi:hypothetical protein
MTANETDPATGTRSTRPEAPAEAASDAPTGNPTPPRPTAWRAFGLTVAGWLLAAVVVAGPTGVFKRD